jgi:MFS family permease
MPLHHALKNAWPLFFGLAMMMVGSGLQGTLLGVRATDAGFPAVVIGIVMSFYYVGYISGTRIIPLLVENVGHIRVFSALAAVASMTILVQGLFVTPAVWAGMRVGTGFAYAGLYIVVESWLNNMATRETRGKILGLYLFTLYLGMVSGQFMLRFADPRDMTLFVLCSIFVSLSLVPIALSKRPGPEFSRRERMNIRELWHASPLGVFAVVLSGTGNSMLTAIGAVYAAQRGFDTAAISTFMAAMAAGGVCFQLPIGHLSDIMDRRRVLVLVSAASVLTSILCYAVSGAAGPALYLSAFLLGGTSMTIYGLCVASVNDRIPPQRYVAASGGMLMVNGFGSIVGPTLGTTIMSVFGTDAYFPAIAVVFGIMSAFCLYRMTQRPGVPAAERASFQPVKPEALAIPQIPSEDDQAA